MLYIFKHRNFSSYSQVQQNLYFRKIKHRASLLHYYRASIKLQYNTDNTNKTLIEKGIHSQVSRHTPLNFKSALKNPNI